MISGEGYAAPNPHFFNMTKNPQGNSGINTKYGFLSVRAYLESCIAYIQGEVTLSYLDDRLPTIRESAAVTAILEAADVSLANDSRVVSISYDSNARYQVVI